MNIVRTLSAAILAFAICTPVVAEDKAPPAAAPSLPPGLQDLVQTAPLQEGDVYMDQAKQAYLAGQYKKSLDLLGKAQTVIRTKRAELFKPLLPPATGKWQIEESKNDNMTAPPALLGGMSLVSRVYTGYGYTVELKFIIDSPMMSMLGGLLQAAGKDAKTEEIKGNKAIYKETSVGAGSHHQLMIFCGDVLISLESTNLPKEFMMQFANAIDYDKIKAVQ
jgi:hypothetical protein